MLFVRRQTRHRMWAAARCPDCGEHPGYGDMCPPRPRRPVTLPPPSQSQLLPSHGKLFCHMRPQKRLKIGSITYCKHLYKNFAIIELVARMTEMKQLTSVLKHRRKQVPLHVTLRCIFLCETQIWSPARLCGVEEWWVGHILFQLSRVVQSIFVQIR